MTDVSVAAPLFGEDDLLARARRGDEAAIRTLVRQNNQRLFRVARSILRDDWEAEDVVQEAYVRAFSHLHDFEGRSSLRTWLTRIVINEALGRLRKRRPTMADTALDNLPDDGRLVPFPLATPQLDPERAMAQTQLSNVLEKAIDALPEVYRVVLIARVLEEMSVEETADLFGLKPETVKTRLHRARALLRRQLESGFGPLLTDAFQFAGARCERMADRVIAQLKEPGDR